MDSDLPPGVALPEDGHDEQVARAAPTVWRARTRWRLTIILAVLSNLLGVAIFLIAVLSPGPRPPTWVFATLMVVINAALLLSAWADQRTFAELRGWQLTAHSALRRTKTFDLRLARRGKLRRHNGVLYCHLRFHRATGHPRKAKVSLDGQEFREALFFRLNLLPDLNASTWLRDWITANQSRDPTP